MMFIQNLIPFIVILGIVLAIGITIGKRGNKKRIRKDTTSNNKEMTVKINKKVILVIVGIIVAIFMLLFISKILNINIGGFNGGNVDEYNNGNNNTNKQYEDLSAKKDEPKELKTTYKDKEINTTITIKKVFWSTALFPLEPRQRVYGKYDEQPGKIYEVVELDIKNNGTEAVSSDILKGDWFDNSCIPLWIFDGGYKYEGATMMEMAKDNEGKYDFEYVYSIEPLETKTLYIWNTVPVEVKDKGLTLSLCYGNHKLNINW